MSLIGKLNLKSALQEKGPSRVVEHSSRDIAVIGMAVKFPQAETVETLWSNLLAGVDHIRPMPENRLNLLRPFVPDADQDHFRKLAYIEGIDHFDHQFFGMSPREAILTDPNQRLFLQCAYHALEDGGYAGDRGKDSLTGVYVGFHPDDMAYKNLITNGDPIGAASVFTGNLTSLIPSRIAYHLGLRGPAMIVDTACSSSLVALHLACRALRTGECDMALAGGVKLWFLPLAGGPVLSIESPDGITRAFDRKASGTGAGEGVGAVLLKPLARAERNGDRIYAVIKGSAVNQDGRSNGIAAPSVDAQADCLEAAWKDAGIDPAKLGMIEAHGTGTALGDPVEVEALRRAFGRYTDKRKFCALGTIKSNMAHLDNAAGIAGFIKAVLSVKYGIVPPSIHYEEPNPNIRFDQAPVFVAARKTPWPQSDGPRTAGVSSFGLSGTNCHVVIGQAPAKSETAAASGPYLLTLSAVDEDGLKRIAAQLLDREIPADHGFCRHLNHGRAHLAQRLALIYQNPTEAREQLVAFFLGENQEGLYRGQATQNQDETPLRCEEAGQAAEHYIAGGNLDWNYFYRNRQTQAVNHPLPLYPFQQNSCWAQPSQAVLRQENPIMILAPRPEPYQWDVEPGEFHQPGLLISDGSAPARRIQTLLEAAGIEVTTVSRDDDPNTILARFPQTRHLIAVHGEDGQVPEALLTRWFPVLAVHQGAQLQLTLIAENLEAVHPGEPLRVPEAAALFGAGLVLDREAVGVRVRGLDLAAGASPQALRKFLLSPPKTFQTALRGEQFYRNVLSQVDLSRLPDRDLRIREGGVYLILGSGGIAVETATWLAGQKPIHLIIAGRSRFDSETLPASTRDRLLSLETLVWDLDQDIDPQTLDKLTHTGPLRGVFHAAGSGIGFPLAQSGDWTAACAGKLPAARIVIQQLLPLQPDFIALFSSAAVYAGAPGTAAYTAANAYLSRLAAYQQNRKTAILAIEWPGWQNTGLAEKVKVQEDKQIFQQLQPQVALDHLGQILTKNISQVIIGAVALQNQWLALPNPGFTWSSDILALIGNGKDQAVVGQNADHIIDTLFDLLRENQIPIQDQESQLRALLLQRLGKTNTAAPEPTSKVKLLGDEKSNPTRRQIAEAWGLVLGLEQIDITQNFFTLGGDSILAMEVAHHLGQARKQDIDPALILRFATIPELADQLDGSAPGSAQNPFPRAPQAEVYPLSFAQKRLYLLNRMTNIGTGYNMPTVMRIRGPIDSARLNQALSQLVTRHEILRTTYRLRGDEPVQIIHPPIAVQAEEEDGRGWDARQLRDRITAFVRPFDFARAPMLRCLLIQCGESDHILSFDVHHIASDGVSGGILAAEFAALYQGRVLPQPQLQYKDFAVFQQTDQARGQTDREWWLRQFADGVPQLELPLDQERPAGRRYRGARLGFLIDTQTGAALKELAGARGATPFMLWLSLFGSFLQRLTEQETMVVGTPVSGRPHRDLDAVMGMFVNTLALPMTLSADAGFSENLSKIKDLCLQAFEHQFYPFDLLVEALAVPRRPDRNPLFDVMFSYQNVGAVDLDMPEWSVEPFDFQEQNAKFDLFLSVMETPAGFAGTLEYDADLFERETMVGWVNGLCRLAEAVAVEPDLAVLTLDLAEPDLLPRKPAVEPPAFSLGHAFLKTAEKQWDHTALVDGSLRRSYRQLAETVCFHAGQLIASGLRKGDLVLCDFDHGAEAVVAALAVVLAGGVYVPLDRRLPEVRRADIIHGLEQSAQVHRFSQIDWSGRGEIKPLVDDIQWDDPAYIVFTSGSTGRPKGVLMAHGNLLNLVQAQQAELDMTGTTLQFSALGFDVSLQEVFGSLIAGGTLVCDGQDDHREPRRLLALLEDFQVNNLFIPTAYFKHVLNRETLLSGLPVSLRHIITAGEALVVSELQQRKLRARGIQLHNHYGPSETHVATSLVLKAEEPWPTRPSIGRALAGNVLYVVNRVGALQPRGAMGELWIGGEGVGLGYFGDELESRRRFLDDPHRGRGRIYRSGDQVRLDAQGNLQFYGRLDDQVKIRGYRVEPGEVAHHLTRDENIAEAEVLAVGSEQNIALVAHVVARADLDVAALKRRLAEHLPDYMVPEHIHFHESLPLNQNGKVDRKALAGLVPNAAVEAEIQAADPPCAGLESELAELWAGVLERPQGSLNRDDDFFALGGHSLKAVALAARIEARFSADLPLEVMFRKPRLWEMAVAVGEAEQSLAAMPEALPAAPFYETGRAQRRIWLADRNAGAYNMPGLLSLNQPMEENQVRTAIARLAMRHEALRTVLPEREGRPVQVIQAQAPDVLRIVDLRQCEAALVESRHREAIQIAFTARFDLAAGPLFQVTWIRLADDRGDLVYNFHHAICDGWSLDLMAAELPLLLRAALTGGDAGLKPLILQYKDLAAWQNRRVEAERDEADAFWSAALEKPAPRLALPRDYAGGEAQAGGYRFFIAAEDRDRYLRFAVRERSALFHVLLTGFSAFLGRISGEEDLLLAVVGAGRNHVEAESVVGCFINTIPLRIHCPAGEAPPTGKVRDLVLRALRYQNHPYEEVLDRNGLPLPNISVLFNMVNTRDGRDQLCRDTAAYHVEPLQPEKFELNFRLREYADGLEVYIGYRRDLYAPATIELMAKNFCKQLDQLTSDRGKRGKRKLKLK